MKQAIPYIRFSSYKQSEGHSYDRQREAVLKWIDNHPEYVLSSLVFEDLGKSGFSIENNKKATGLIKINEAIKAGLIKSGDVILIEAFDRATRQQSVDALSLINPILKAGVNITTLDDNITYTKESLNGGHAFLLIAKIQAAHGYSKILSERVKESYKKREIDAKEGRTIKRHTPVWLTTQGEVIEHIANEIRGVFDMYIAGAGKMSIAAKVRECGVEELSTCAGPTITNWLSNPTVIGYWNDIPNVYPAIIPLEKYHLVQRMVKERAKKKYRTSPNPLSGIIKCHHCGSSMIIHNINGKPNSFRCLSHHRLKQAGCTNNKSIPYNIILYLYLMSASSAVEVALAKQTLTSNEKERIILEASLPALSEKIANRVKLIDTLGNVEEITKEIAQLVEERNQIQKRIEILSREDNQTEESFKEAKDGLREFYKLSIENPSMLNGSLKAVGWGMTCSIEGGIVIQRIEREGDAFISYVYKGVKRKEKSNQTAYYRMGVVIDGREVWVEKITAEEINLDKYFSLNPLSSIPEKMKDICLGKE
ncbi:recombinase family protein [Aquipseudomonas alcaligenes]|uniref:Recombinase zinc beta ribbon domain-containing protein n=1 Tax=Aquipseudomonas alcaligenes TaxID=43263 RepID=A0A1N6WN79_AQUAC|nr:recombinase family protein [Pseudomonas alcaligenes]SIQ91496.1 Recombinase zinc beta ribbon domain-containing protein [Pseudomonas alcaligenes]